MILAALEEIRHDIASQDFTKARLVIDHLPQLSGIEQKAILQALSEAPDAFSIPMLSYFLVVHPTLARDYPEVSKTVLAKADLCPEIVLEGIVNEGPEQVHFLKIAGVLGIQDAVPILLKQVFQLEEKQSRLVSIASLGALGNPAAISVLTEFLYIEDLDLRVAAILALGRISSPSAVEVLSDALGNDTKTDCLILDVFAEVQNDLCIRKLNESLKAGSAIVRNHARAWFEAIGGASIPVLISNLSDIDDDFRILTLNILQKVGNADAALAIRDLINTRPANPNLRFAAFEALADLSNRVGDYVLAGGLTDQDGSVRVAAAKAIDRNLDARLAVGIMKMVEGADDEAGKIIKAIIDARADNLFMSLIDSAEFKAGAVMYLGAEVHQEVRDFFISRLRQNDRFDLISDILENKSNREGESRGMVCVVDDSEMILSIYRSVMSELGYDTRLFSKASEAIPWLKEVKPDFLCTDLNMPGITGIELIRTVRKTYDRDELPIVLITTQNEDQDNKAAIEAGANEIMTKPFDAEMVASVFSKIRQKPDG